MARRVVVLDKALDRVGEALLLACHLLVDAVLLGAQHVGGSILALVEVIDISLI